MFAYVEKFLRPAAEKELGPLPDDVTLIFGHTHKPFEASWEFSGFAKPVKVYNSGGWAIDPDNQIATLRGGAAILLDDELNAASLRLFNEHETAAEYRVRVAHAGDENPLAERLAGLVDPAKEPYKTLSENAYKGVKVRYELVRRVLAGADTGAN